MHHDKRFESGELIITGDDAVEIHLNDIPHHVSVHFKKKPHPSPCDHHGHHHHHDDDNDDDDHDHERHDKLEWEIQRSHHNQKYRLIIKWKVSSVREILWLADY
jgi:hypothetical protein